MKRPMFNAAKVVGVTTALSGTNNTAIKLVDPIGTEMVVNLAPPVRVQLAQFLLTRPPVGGPGEVLAAGVRLQAQDFALFDHRGSPVLEILLGPNQAIHIGLQGLQPDTLLDLLQRYQAGRAQKDTPH